MNDWQKLSFSPRYTSFSILSDFLLWTNNNVLSLSSKKKAMSKRKILRTRQHSETNYSGMKKERIDWIRFTCLLGTRSEMKQHHSLTKKIAQELLTYGSLARKKTLVWKANVTLKRQSSILSGVHSVFQPIFDVKEGFGWVSKISASPSPSRDRWQTVLFWSMRVRGDPSDLIFSTNKKHSSLCW